MTVRGCAKLNQVVCHLEGMATLLHAAPGDFAVVIHGDRDCANVLVHGVDHPGAERFFCTNVTEAQAVSGQALGRLRDCLEAVHQALAPEVTFVLGTCLSALVGEDVASVVASAPGRVVSLPGGGMRRVSQAEELDRFACLMASVFAHEARGPGVGVNLVGFDPGAEVIAQLGAWGVEVNAILVPGAGVSVWRRVGGAAINLVLDRVLFDDFCHALETRHGVVTREVPFPVGHSATRTFYEKVLAASPSVIAASPSVPAPSPSIDTLAAEARAAVSAGRRRFEGLRVGYNIGSMKNLNPRTLAQEGLGDLPVFEELGCEPVILVQGDDRPARVDAIRETLAGFGCRARLAVFADTVQFGRLCLDEGCELVYASDHLRDQVIGVGAGFVATGTLAPGFGAMAANIARLMAALGTVIRT